ncbi:DegT/DnrJ/EryC1/StrS family aminotransferase [Streptomyces gibsoniae]|uniref:DegT/DnrJ/EryC1/StrS family aminotransferase n=1 Tax=Streptomyces gibsoniae TaxID=3075529 RepID=A0ABU2TLQ5_9ACTN|nr:DegT/DnrJ/EryC1/StrS family aminotransferase [Streptomyces sp. DSM 41699]MDT0461870.1 DegT/DnrJ/EryC1/StrS family aminotransferase [Streptomyces sp. DSM 41699]
MIEFFPPDLFKADREALLEIVRTIGTGPEQRFILGGATARLERELAAELGAADVIACSSGTSALTLILHAMGVGPGDEAVVPAYGCAPLAAAVVNLGATPVFADIDPWTLVVDPSDVEACITERTKVLLPAHIYSVMADMPRLLKIAERYDVRLVEDSAVAQGAVLDGRPAGLWGEAGLYSFVQVKSFGTAGEGGAVVTNDRELARDIRMLRNHGQDGRHRFLHHMIGHNSRFDEIQATFLLHRLPGFPDRLERRARIADYYAQRFSALAEHGVLAPPTGRNGRCYYVYTLMTERRDALRDHLARHGIASHVYYPSPLPLQPAFASYAPPGRRWPHAERASRCTLSIPVHPLLTDAQAERIADVVCAFAVGDRGTAVAGGE